MLEEGKRIHGLDALRAVAMLLGVLLHATIAYRVEDAPFWIYDKEYGNIVLDFIYFFIHSFRMPLFYLVAGFFCRFLYYKRTEKEFIKNRWMRVGLPFIIGLITIVPLSMFPLRVYYAVFNSNLTWEDAYRRSFLQMFGRNGVAHLWFLYDLLMYYAVVVVIKKLSKKFAGIANFFQKFSKWLHSTRFNNALWLMLLSTGVFVILIRDERLFVLADTYLMPREYSYILFYGYFFTLGWLIHKRQDLLQDLIKNYLQLIIPALIICAALFYIEITQLLYKSRIVFYCGKFSGSVLIVLFTLGFTGFFLRFFQEQSKVWRYISDASYWIYLVHMGMVLAFQLFFLNSSVPGFVRFLLSFAIPLFTALATYQLFVRYTFIGTVLHGPRKRE